jgi:Domain of unknown function (DUF6851)/VCPO second helical-bundle domain
MTTFTRALIGRTSKMRFAALTTTFIGRARNLAMVIAAIRIQRFDKTVGVLATTLALTLTVSTPVLGDDELHFTPNPQPHSVVVDWIEAMLFAIELNPPAPTATTWRMLVATTSMYDAWSAYDQKSLPVASGMALKREQWEHTETNKEIAVSHAAYRALSFLFPDQQYIFDEVMEYHGLIPSNSTDISTPAGIGNIAASNVINTRVTDGSNSLNGFRQLTSTYYPELYSPFNSANPDSPKSLGGPEWDPNRWTPLRVPRGSLIDDSGNPYYIDEDPTSYSDQVFLTPHWGAITPYALTSGDQFRPPAPPQLGSSEPYLDALGNLMTNDEAYRSQAEEVLHYSAELTDTHKIIAEFWADGPATWTPPGHWMQIANGISIRDGYNIDEDVRLYMAIAGAVFDAGIVAWEAKRAYDYIRPASALPYLYSGQQVLAWGGPNQGTQTINGEDWKPYQQSTFVTPAFAEFVSGHSTFSAAAAYTLAAFTGSDALYDGVTGIGRDYDNDGFEDLLGQHYATPGTMIFEEGPAVPVLLQWNTLTEAAEEAGLSRLYGGIHFQDGNLRGRDAGNQVGLQAYQLSELYWDPFGKILQTVEEFEDTGDIRKSFASLLGNHLMEAQLSLSQRHPQRTCARTHSIERLLSTSHNPNRRARHLSEDAVIVISQQLDKVASLVCSKPQYSRQPKYSRQKREFPDSDVSRDHARRP